MTANKPRKPHPQTNTTDEEKPDDQTNSHLEPNDYAAHLARVCARFPTTISPEGARRLARLLHPPEATSPPTSAATSPRTYGRP